MVSAGPLVFPFASLAWYRINCADIDLHLKFRLPAPPQTHDDLVGYRNGRVYEHLTDHATLILQNEPLPTKAPVESTG